MSAAAWMTRGRCVGDMAWLDRACEDKIADCRECVVRTECLALGLHVARHGTACVDASVVYGGRVPAELVQLRQARRRTAVAS